MAKGRSVDIKRPRSDPQACLSSFSFLTQSLALVAQANGEILAHHKLHLLGSNDSPASASQVAGITGMRHHAQLILYFLVEMGFLPVGQAGLELLTSGDSYLAHAGITGRSHCTQPYLLIFVML